MGTTFMRAGDALNGDGWGLHDGELLRFRVDYRARTLELDLLLATSERQDRKRPALFVVTGLIFFVAEPPNPSPTIRRPYWERAGCRIDVRDITADELTNGSPKLPAIPDGAWCSYLWDDGLNACLWIAGENCVGTWVGDEQSADGGVFFPREVVDTGDAGPHGGDES